MTIVDLLHICDDIKEVFLLLFLFFFQGNLLNHDLPQEWCYLTLECGRIPSSVQPESKIKFHVNYFIKQHI